MFAVAHSTELGARHSLGRCRLFESSDIDEACDRIGRVMQPHHLKPVGPFCRNVYRMDYLRIGGLGMGTIRLGRTQVDCGEIDGYHLLIFCIEGNARIAHSVGETEIGKMRGVCLWPGELFQGEFSEDCEQLVFRIDPKLMDSHAGQRNSRLVPILDLNKRALAPWTSLVCSILHDPCAIEMILGNPRIAADYEQLLIGLLLSGQGLLEQPKPTRGAACASVRRAELFIREHFAEGLRLDDIAAASGVPARTLLDSFRHFRQTSPMRYLRNVRLDAVRERLLIEHEANISLLAFDAGFGHLGRFARDYCDRFCETPSQTRQNARGVT